MPGRWGYSRLVDPCHSMQIHMQHMIEFFWCLTFVMVNPHRDNANHQRTEQTAGIIFCDGKKVIIAQFIPDINRNIFVMYLLHWLDQVILDLYFQNGRIVVQLIQDE